MINLEGGMQQSSKDSIKMVIQSLIVLLLGWVGTTVMQIQRDNAVIQAQLADIRLAMNNIPGMQTSIAINRADITRLQDDVKEVKRHYGLD
jgi:hypothetical protein